MPRLHMIPADKTAMRVFSQFDGEIDPNDVGFVCRRYDRPPREAPDRFTDGGLVGYREHMPFYPASVVKVFFMVALFRKIRDGAIVPDREDERALANMIRISSNNATTYLVNRMTGTTGGMDLSPGDMAAWWEKRSWVHRYFQAFGWPEFDPIRVFHATYEESPYGREQTCRDRYGANVLTPLAAASLMHAIAAEQVIDRDASTEMMALLSRDWARTLPDPESQNQVRGFVAEGIPDDARVWSKAGSTRQTRHDLVYIERPGGQAMTLAVFTRGCACARNGRFLPVLGRALFEDLLR